MKEPYRVRVSNRGLYLVEDARSFIVCQCGNSLHTKRDLPERIALCLNFSDGLSDEALQQGLEEHDARIVQMTREER